MTRANGAALPRDDPVARKAPRTWPSSTGRSEGATSVVQPLLEQRGLVPETSVPPPAK